MMMLHYFEKADRVAPLFIEDNVACRNASCRVGTLTADQTKSDDYASSTII